MGRIKSTPIKRTGEKLVEQSRAMFTESFEHNKKALKDTMPSKPIRNRVAGYISRLVKMEKKVRKPKIQVAEDSDKRDEY